MSARTTLYIVLLVLIIPGVVFSALLYASPSTTHTFVDGVVSRLYPTNPPESAYSIFVLGSFVYLIVLLAGIVYLALSDVSKRLDVEGNA